MFLIFYPDRCPALLRVHLLGHHELPVLLLRPRLGPRFNLHGAGRGDGFVHLAHRMVSFIKLP